jgi:Protein of unknown function (DUF4254)
MRQFDAASITSILNLQVTLTAQWHHTMDTPLPGSGLAQLVCQQHQSNYELWHLEDDARATAVSDTVIAAIKRSIDKVNQRRNDRIELIDEHLVAALPINVLLPLNTETPGSVFDRLSINALKIFHMTEQVNRTDASEQHIERCAGRVSLLQEQRNDLSSCLMQLFLDLCSNQKRLKVYRQVKMYNDPQLNPVLSKENTLK